MPDNYRAKKAYKQQMKSAGSGERTNSSGIKLKEYYTPQDFRKSY